MKAIWRIKRQRKPGRKPKARPMTKEEFADMQRADDFRAVIRGTMSHAQYAAKWGGR